MESPNERLEDRLTRIYGEFWTESMPAEEFEDYDEATDEGKWKDGWNRDDRNLIINVGPDGAFTGYLHNQVDEYFDIGGHMFTQEDGDTAELVNVIAHTDTFNEPDSEPFPWLDHVVLLYNWVPVVELESCDIFEVGRYLQRIRASAGIPYKIDSMREDSFCFWCGKLLKKEQGAWTHDGYKWKTRNGESRLTIYRYRKCKEIPVGSPGIPQTFEEVMGEMKAKHPMKGMEVQ